MYNYLCFFFAEFHLWKQIMETQVKTKYLALKKTALQTYYQCNYVSPKNEEHKTYLCPSLVYVKYLQTGIQIRYGMKHHGHSCPEYQLPDQFSHLVTSLKKEDISLKNSDSEVTKADPDADLLSKFQNLMGSITVHAAKLSTPNLKKLFNSALEMQGILNSLDDEYDQDAPPITKSMTDDQITNALEGKRTSARLKRKSETRSSVDAKKKKATKSDLAENTDNTVFKENKEYESPNVTARSSPLLSPSFVDSFKQFIGEPTQESTKKNRNVRQKEIVKTKMGQFSPKKKLNDEESVEKRKYIIPPKKKLIVEEDVEKIKPSILPKKQLIVAESAAKINQNITPKKQLIVEEPAEKSKKNILKPSRTNTSVSLGSDIKYEVREQDNDCNILILKI